MEGEGVIVNAMSNFPVMHIFHQKIILVIYMFPFSRHLFDISTMLNQVTSNSFFSYWESKEKQKLRRCHVSVHGLQNNVLMFFGKLISIYLSTLRV